MNTRITRYCTFKKGNVARIAAALGGLEVTVDPAAAGALNISSGRQKLSPDKLAAFVRASSAGKAESFKRQVEVMKSLFRRLQNGNLVISTLIAQQLIANTETDFRNTEMVDFYKKFREVPRWEMKSLVLPTEPIQKHGRVIHEPITRLLRFD